MNKNDLKTGDIVKTRGEEICIVMLNARIDTDTTEDLLICIDDGYFLSLKEYDEDLKQFNRLFSKYDIINVYTLNYTGDLIRKVFKYNKNTEFNWTWKEKNVKKMTVSEICKELGYDVEIVKED